MTKENGNHDLKWKGWNLITDLCSTKKKMKIYQLLEWTVYCYTFCFLKWTGFHKIIRLPMFLIQLLQKCIFCIALQEINTPLHKVWYLFTNISIYSLYGEVWTWYQGMLQLGKVCLKTWLHPKNFKILNHFLSVKVTIAILELKRISFRGLNL